MTHETIRKRAAALVAREPAEVILSAAASLQAQRRGERRGGRKPVPTKCRCGELCPSARAARHHCVTVLVPRGDA